MPTVVGTQWARNPAGSFAAAIMETCHATGIERYAGKYVAIERLTDEVVLWRIVPRSYTRRSRRRCSGR